MESKLSGYFSEVEDPQVKGWCLYLLSDILIISIMTYLTGGTDCQDMHLFGKERGKQFKDLLSLLDKVPSADTFERISLLTDKKFSDKKGGHCRPAGRQGRE
jgi:hypothetical protein